MLRLLYNEIIRGKNSRWSKGGGTEPLTHAVWSSTMLMVRFGCQWEMISTGPWLSALWGNRLEIFFCYISTVLNSDREPWIIRTFIISGSASVSPVRRFLVFRNFLRLYLFSTEKNKENLILFNCSPQNCFFAYFFFLTSSYFVLNVLLPVCDTALYVWDLGEIHF